MYFAVATDGDFCPWTDWSPCVNGIQIRTRDCSCPSASCCGNSVNLCQSFLAACGLDLSILRLCPAKRCSGQPMETRSCCPKQFDAQGTSKLFWFCVRNYQTEDNSNTFSKRPFAIRLRYRLDFVDIMLLIVPYL